MKITVLTCLASAALVFHAFSQTPPPPPDQPAAPVGTIAPVATVAPVATIAPSASPAATATTATTPRDPNDLQSRIERKARKHGLNITFGDDEKRDADAADVDKTDSSGRSRKHSHDSDIGDGAFMAIPIVGIIFSTLFGAPVLIVAVIMFFSYIKSRSLHRTVRLMVEKGQPVPEALFATPHSPAKLRSDVRRGIVLVMVGLGLMIFFGASSDWDGGSWALGVIPFLIGAGYLLVWKLEGPKRSTDNPPALP
ncbi:MAG: DUF6249 domain-containing protein [Chthoniobacterales bacterium]